MNSPLGSIVAAATGKVMSGLDQLFTSDHERAQVAAAVDAGLNSLAGEVLAHQAMQEKERTSRHATDMNADSWLSKNIRPLTLIALTSAFILLVLADSSPILFAVRERWIDLLETLLVSVYGFYFVSRGVQAVAQSLTQMKAGKNHG